jgi:hypothetical protein
MRKTYQIESRKLATDIQFTYSEPGYLVGFMIVADVAISPAVIAGVLDNALTIPLLRNYCQQHKLTMIEVLPDLSFDTFWNRYNYKEAGDKADAKKKWALLSDADKVKALAYIHVDNNHRLASGAARKYAKTYLHQRVWES